MIVSIDVKIRRQTIKRLKHIVLLSLLVIGSIVLVACSPKTDNGTYVYDPSKEDIKKTLKNKEKILKGLIKQKKPSPSSFQLRLQMIKVN